MILLACTRKSQHCEYVDLCRLQIIYTKYNQKSLKVKVGANTFPLILYDCEIMFSLNCKLKVMLDSYVLSFCRIECKNSIIYICFRV